MKSENINEATYTGKPVVARKGGKLGAVLLDKDGKPISGSWKPENQVPGGIPATNKSAFFRKEADKLRDAEKQRLRDVGNPPTATAPPTSSGGSGGANRVPSAPTRRPAPAPTPQASPVAKYMASAAAARKIQDPVQRAAEMEKVKQTGLDIWKNKYKDTLAKRVGPTGQQLGTGQSVMAKQAAELRNLRQPTAPTPQVQAKSNLPGGDYSPAATANMSQRTKNILGTRKEAYDLVLDYLLSEGHADTVDEAHYVMMQMSAEHVQDIVEMGDPSFEIKKSSGVGALTPAAAAQLGQKAVELQKKKAAGVDLPNLKQSPGSMAQGV